MSYLALYRKYRSKTFDELVGQDAIVQTLKNALTKNKIAHAYLFCGPRGTGKTSIARLFAKALNCDEGVGYQCNRCSNCEAINENSHPDVIEIDAASNSGVEEVRNLIDKVKYGPIKGRYKVYIIDEVHMMTNSAFNALLKTLEEPPSNTVFILCTTEPYKLLPTIVSRCQRYDFTKIPDEQLDKLLKRVLKEECITYEDGVIESLVELANGGARDALSILDQIIAYSNNHISLKNIEDVFGLTSIENKIELLTLLSKKDTQKTLSFVESLEKRNVDISRLLFELLNILKDVLIYSKTTQPSLLKYINEASAKSIINMFKSDELLNIIDLLIKCQNEIKISSNPLFILEIYLLKIINLGDSNKELEEEKVVISTKKPAKHDDNWQNVKNINPNVYKKQEEIPLPPKQDKVVKQEVKVEEPKPVEPEKAEAPSPKVEEPKPINQSAFVPINLEGDTYHLDRDQIIKLMVSGKKDLRKQLYSRWNELDSLLSNSKYGAYIMLLKDGLPFITTDNMLILAYDHKVKAQRVNIKENEKVLGKIIKQVFKLDVQVYGLNREEQAEYYGYYLSLSQVNNLPKISEIEEIKLK